MKKKLLSVLFALTLTLSLSAPAFASELNDTNDMYAFRNNILYADDSGNLDYNSDSIVVLSEEQALNLGSKVAEIAGNCEMVYVTGDVDLNALATACSLPQETYSESLDEDRPTIGVAIDNNDGKLDLNEITIIAENPASVLNSRDNSLLYDGIEAALNIDPYAPIVDGPQMYYPESWDAYSNKSAIVYDSGNKNIGTMSFTAYFYKKGTYTSGYMFDTVCRSTFAPKTGYYCGKMYTTLGHTGSGYPSHEIIDQTRIGSNGSTYTHSLSLSASKQGISGGGTTSWMYTVDAQNVTNGFSASNQKTWTFKPVKGGNGDAWVEEPGIRSVSSGSKCYTTITLKCPWITIFNIELKENTMSYNVYFNY